MTADDRPDGDGDGAADADGRRRIEVCPADELPPGSRTIVDVDGREIGVFNVDGEFHALRNACPHQLAPLCAGQLVGEMTAPAVGEYELIRQGEIVQCPWHGWRFDLATGESVFNPHLRTGSYDVAVERVPERVAPDDATAQGDADDGDHDGTAREEAYGTALAGDEPPVDTYDVSVERSVVVLYL